jgi:hypothetical protein
MPARVVPSMPQGISKEANARTIWLSPRQGLLKARSPRATASYLDPCDLRSLSLNDRLIRTLNHWVGRYAAFAQGLPYSYKPEDCVEFPLESFNAEGQFIAEEITRSLDEGWLVIFTPIVRDQFLHVSRLMDLHGYRYNAEPRLEAWGDGTPILRDEPDEYFPGRWVRFMFDHCSSCLWDRADCGSTIEGLPIPAALSQELEAEIDILRDAWEDWDFNDGRPAELSPAHLAQRMAFAAAGLAIARKLKAALPEDWTVVYFDIDRAARRALRAEFEYRI